jgi:hypothetical protein
MGQDNNYRFCRFRCFNLRNRPTDDATVSVRKSASEKELLFVRLRVRKIIVSIKGA